MTNMQLTAGDSPLRPRTRRSRQSIAPGRREQILAAGLPLFLSRGVAHTTIDDLATASDSSIGSIYHWFGSKAGVAASLYVSALEQIHRVALAALTSDNDVRKALRTAISAYLTWVLRNPDLASYALHCREPEVAVASADAVSRLNDEFEKSLHRWLSDGVRSGALKDFPDSGVFLAILMGPAQEYARAWLATTRRARQLRRAAVLLGDAAVVSLCV